MPEKNRQRSTTLYCFSPPVMLATIAVETGLLVYVLVRYKMNRVGRLVAATLLLLALFQVAEFETCGRTLGSIGLAWSRFGFVAITLLPALGIHLTQLISGRRLKYLTWITDISAAGLVAAFAFLPTFLNSPVCGGNYVVFVLKEPLSWLYSYYYLGLLAAGIVVAYLQSRKAKPNTRRALQWVVAGYLAFLIPTGVANTLSPSTIKAIPSIMCGFAVIYAVILVARILPLVGTLLESPGAPRR